MEPVAYRVGAMVAALSAVDDGRVYGIMLTASHNPVDDNGVKIIGPDGGILPSRWEAMAEELMSTPLSGLQGALEKYLPLTNRASARGRIAVGRDTRPSGKELVKAVQEGAAIFRAEIIDLDLVTTPECHSALATLNKSELRLGATHLQNKYIDGLAGHFMNLMGAGESKGLRTSFSSQSPVVVDCANGIGAQKMYALMEKLPCCFFNLVNDAPTPEAILNDKCGADFVKSNGKPPSMIEDIRPWGHFASLDGDADRLVYFTFDDSHQFLLLDGDRIAALFALTFKTLLERAGLADRIQLGVIQTAYANGAATSYLEGVLGVPVHFTSTGVKYLHKAAETCFDVGIYFEANGHGTVLAKPFVLEMLLECTGAQEKGLVKIPVGEAARTLQRLLSLSNQLVGDGIADLLLVEAMLRIMNLDIKTWAGLYTERPSTLVKINVNDRTKIVTTDADRKVVKPLGLQEEIDVILKTVADGRAFARPSGTEDVVRIYCEASTKEHAKHLSHEVQSLLAKYNL